MNKWIPLIAMTSLLLAGAAAGDSSSRLWDRDVADVMKQVVSGVERVEGDLDRQYRGAIIRSSRGEADISAFLRDFKQDCKLMRQRFDAGYSASTEVETCLRRAARLEERYRLGSSLFGSEEAYERFLRPDAVRLAGAYGADFAGDPESWTVRRINDRELEQLARAIPGATKAFRKDLRSTLASLERNDRRAFTSEIDRLLDASADLQRQIKRKSNVTDTLRAVASSADRIEGLVSDHGSTADQAAWLSVSSSIARVASAFDTGS